MAGPINHLKIDPENLELQVAELDMLTAMFPSEDELILDNPAVVCEINDWIEKQQFKEMIEVPPCISFKLRLRYEPGPKVLEVCLRFPSNYPGSEPLEIYCRSENLSRTQQTDFNEQLSSKIRSDFVAGDLMCGALVAWLQENGESFIQEEKPKKKPFNSKDGKRSGKRSEPIVQYARLWILSHHIYRKESLTMTKRKDILELCRDLTGFCMPGKPGLICLEGTYDDCNKAWSTIKAWNWKRIILKHQETEDSRSTSLTEFRKFSPFEEIGFVKMVDPSVSYHMDMSEFHEYLKKHYCQTIFKILFNID